jgi:hypothetical protein
LNIELVNGGKVWLWQLLLRTGSKFFKKVDWRTIYALDQSVMSGKFLVRKMTVEKYLLQEDSVCQDAIDTYANAINISNMSSTVLTLELQKSFSSGTQALS